MLFGKVSIHRVHIFDISVLNARREAGFDHLGPVTAIEIRIRTPRPSGGLETFGKGSDAVVRTWQRRPGNHGAPPPTPEAGCSDVDEPVRY
jgi:hypothetical protein